MGKFLNWVSDHAPQILVGAGVALGTATVVLACVETTKAGAILDKHNEEIKKIEEAKKVANPEEHTEKDEKNDKIVIFRDTTLSLAKLYWPSALTGIAAIVCTLSGHKILSARYGAASLALTATQGLFSKYRNNVIKDVGHDKDWEYITGSKIERTVVEEEVTNPETGKKKKQKVQEEYIDIDVGNSAFWFKVFGEFNGDGSKNYEWDSNPDLALYSLRLKQQWWTDHLRTKGIVFLNEVLEDLGMPMETSGQIYGWKYEPGVCDYVSFGIGDYSDDNVRRFINKRDDCLVLCFNIYGEYDDNGTLITPEPIINCLKG